MSRILRRPMFRGGSVDGRGTGITSGLGYEKGGRVPRTNYSVGGIGRQMANVARVLDDTRGGSNLIDEFGQKLTFKPSQTVDRVVESTPTIKNPGEPMGPGNISVHSPMGYAKRTTNPQQEAAAEFLEAIKDPRTGGIDYKMAEMKIGTKLKGDETIEELVSMYLYSTRKDKLGVAALATGYGGLGAGAMMNDGQNYMANGGRVGLGNGGSYADALAQGEFEASKGNRLTFQSVIDRMNDYYNNLYTKGMFEEDLDMGMQIPRPMDTKEIVQSRIYEGTDPILGDKGKDVFQEEFFKGTFDDRNYNKELADSAKAFAKFNQGEENPYRDPDAPAPGKVVIDDPGSGTGDGTGTTDTKTELEERKKLFAELLGGDKARGEDISNMLMSFAGKALKPEATVKSAFGEFAEAEAKRPSRRQKVEDAAAQLAINKYIKGEISKAEAETLIKRLELQAKFADERTAKSAAEYIQASDAASFSGRVKEGLNSAYSKEGIVPEFTETDSKTMTEEFEFGPDDVGMIFIEKDTKRVYTYDSKGNQRLIYQG